MKKTVLLVGNGFTINFLKHLGLQDEINTSLASLMPPPQWVHIAHCGKWQLEQTLFTLQRFPYLTICYKQGRNFLDVCNECSGYLVNPHASIGRWTHNCGDVGLELRRYLHALFVAYDLRIAEFCQKTKSAADSEWRRIIEILYHKSRLVCISYNYDFNLEKYYLLPIARYIDSPTESAIYNYRQCTQSRLLCIKPHGCITHVSPAEPFRRCDDFSAGNLCRQKCRINKPTNAVYPPPYLTVPDLVPPGHWNIHTMTPYSTAFQAALVAIREADIIIIVGFKGEGADLWETNLILKSIRSKTRILQISPERNFIGESCRNICGHNFVKFDPKELSFVRSDIDCNT